MEKNLEGKRNREEEKDGELLKIVTYLSSTQKRLLKNCIPVPAPKGKGLIKDCQPYKNDSDNGYIRIHFNGKMEYVHRVALMIALGVLSLPKTNDKGEAVECAHKCDNPRCCEPSHLYLATKAENGEDRVKNGLTRGEKNHNAVITDEIAQLIKLSKGEGTQHERADRFNVSVSTVRNVDGGGKWSHLLDINGNNSHDKRRKQNEVDKKHKQLLASLPWSKNMCDRAQEKINDDTYAKTDYSHSFKDSYCRLWICGHIRGYPRMHICGQSVFAHIMACVIGNNYIRPENMQASHECGQSSCVNPLHLTFKKATDNAADKIKHGTHATLPWKHVLEIRERYAKGEERSDIARAYNVTPSYVGQIINNKRRING